ncbi:MAG: hypothetical protein ACE5DR_03930, partial [Thermodesulfobacteriota bacterium]
CPSGGCLLTDRVFSRKVRDLVENKKDIEKRDLQLLRTGRHFRYEGFKIVVGRDEADNARLKALLRPQYMAIEPVDFPGPLVVITEEAPEGVREFAAGLILRYASDKAGGDKKVRISFNGESRDFIPERSATEDDLKEAMVCG